MEHTPISPGEASPGALAFFLLSQPRASLEALTEALLIAQDLLDGDPEAEPTTWSEGAIREDETPDDCEDDDPQGQIDEDEVNTEVWKASGNGPGCTISDAGGNTDDDHNSADQTYPEWHTLPGSQKQAGLFYGKAFERSGLLDDSEDDDRDGCMKAEDQGTAGGRWFDRDGAPGDSEDGEPDPDREYDGQWATDQAMPVTGFDDSNDLDAHRVMKIHRDRIRRTRCQRVKLGGMNGGIVMVEYRLPRPANERGVVACQ